MCVVIHKEEEAKKEKEKQKNRKPTCCNWQPLWAELRRCTGSSPQLCLLQRATGTETLYSRQKAHFLITKQTKTFIVRHC